MEWGGVAFGSEVRGMAARFPGMLPANCGHCGMALFAVRILASLLK